MFELLIAGAILGICFYYLAVKPMSYWKDRGVNQLNPIPLFGDIFGTLSNKETYSEVIEKAYKSDPKARYHGLYQFTRPTIIIKDVDLIKQFSIKDFDHFMDHTSFISEKADPLWGTSLFALKGKKWSELRPIISACFTSSKMRALFVLMKECAENFSNYFVQQNGDSIEVEMKEIITRFTNDVTATTAFGIKTDSLADPENEFYLMGKEVSNVSGFWRRMKFFGYFLFPKVLEFFKIRFFEEHIAKFFTDLIDETIKVREEKGIIRPDMVHILMEARKGIENKEENVIDSGFAANTLEFDLGKVGKKVTQQMTNHDIAAQALFFFFSGYDSVSDLMCFMAYELAINPDIQNRLRDEIHSTLDECKGDLTYEALLSMKYMDMVVSETLRKWPAVIALDRICTKDFTIQPVNSGEKPVTIERGTVVWFPNLAMQRDPKYYPDPDRFDPERFNDENKQKVNPYVYNAFGIGRRLCIGTRYALMETKIVFFYLLNHFELVPNAKTLIPLKFSTKSFNLLVEEGFWFDLKRIHK